MDLHTANLFRLVRAAADRYVRLDANQLPKPWREASLDFPVVLLTWVAGGVDVAQFDDDAPVRPLPVRLFMRFNNAWMPFRDEDEMWSSGDEARAGLDQAFGKYLPPVSVKWQDVHGQTTDLFARQALGAQHLRRVTDADDVRPGETYVSGFEFMSRYAVREGLMPYGGDAYLSDDGRVVRIRLHGHDHHPGDASWAHATFVYRSSAMAWATLNDHVFHCHYAFMNPVLLATKRHLPLAHALRHFLAPFHYRTAAINNGGMLSLVPPGATFHRTTSLTWDALHQLYTDCVTSFRCEPFPASLARKGILPEQLGSDAVRLFPFSTDGMEYWSRVRAFVDDAFGQSPALRRVLAEDRAQTDAWWEAIRTTMPGGLPDLSDESLRDFLAQVVFQVTAFHEHVGNVSQYIANPTLVTGKLWPGQTIADRQSSLQLGVIGCITGLRMPKLMEDFGHMMPDAESRDALHRFQDALRAWQTEVDARNAGRPQPFVSFSPRELSCSVSI